MKKIKIIGFFVFLLSVALVFLFNYISKEEQQFSQKLSQINIQKSHTQEIAKSIFFTHRYKKEYPKTIDKNMYNFLSNLQIKKKNDHNIHTLSHAFFELVNQFKYVYTGNVPYNIIILEKLVNDIYKKNMELIVAFNKYTTSIKAAYDTRLKRYRALQYLLFTLLITLLIYIFTQVEEIIRFIQQFTRTSNRIMERSSIQGLEPIDILSHNVDLDIATDNFNALVSNIDASIKVATDSTSYTVKALEVVESNIGLLVSLLHKMKEDKKEEMYKKEDTVIESLETLMELTEYLKNLKKDLERLI
jgi:predicted PurR-regulated permease PerM